MLLGFLISVPGLTLLLMAWVGWTMWRRRALVRRAERAGSCKLCGTPFSEAHIEFAGAVSAAERRAMDRFQARFASFKIRCHECGSLNVCAADGTAFKAIVEREG